MKKLVIVIAAMAVSVASFAQTENCTTEGTRTSSDAESLDAVAAPETEEQVCEPEFEKTLFLGLRGGAQVFNGLNDKFLPMGERVAANGGLNVGMWFNRLLGAEFNLTCAQFKGLYTSPASDKHFTTSEMFQNGSLRYQNGMYGQVDANVLFDVLAACSKKQSKHHLLPYAGAGCAIAFGEVENHRFAFATNAGLQYRFDLLPSLGLLASFDNTWVTKNLENEFGCNHAFHWVYGVKAGLYYTISCK